MAIIHLTEKTFDSTIAENPIVIIDFWAEWCAPCLSFAKIYEKVAEEYPELVFAKINIDEEPTLKDDLQIISIPQVMIFKKNVLIFSQSGLMPAYALRDLIEQAKTVEM